MAIVLAATPAQAATGTVDGIRYSADADTGHATVADYDGTQGADVTIPAVVSIGGDDYSVTTIGAFAFSSNGLIDVAIPATVTSIGEWAFFANQLKKVTIPATVTSIGAWAFHFNDLERVTLAEGVTTIGAFAFHDNELESVTIPATVTAIGEWAYNENPDLIRVKFLGPAPEVVASTNELRSFDTASGSLTLHYVAKYGTPTAPDGFTTPTWNGYTTAPSATITGDPTAAGAVGTEFIYTPTVTGTPTPEVTTSSPLPDGLNLDASGVISGTPAESAGGEYPITLTASNTGGTSSHDVTVTINEAPTLGGSPPASELTVADSFDFTPNVSGFPAPAFDLSGSLPAGLFFHSSTGEVVGTAGDNAVGSYPVTVTATNEAGTDTLTYTIEVIAGDVATMTLTPSDTTPDQGDTITIDVDGFDAFGNPTGDETTSTTFTSSVASDAINGNELTFNDASPHIITATHDTTAVTATTTINVTPTPPAATPTTEPAVTAGGLLPDTGGLTLGLLALALTLTLAGAALITHRPSGSRSWS